MDARVQQPQSGLEEPMPAVYPLILTLDTHGVPHRWITWQHACYYYAKDQVAWTLGEHAFTVYGGLNRVTGTRSEISASSIIAIKGKAMAMKSFNQVPPLNNRELFHRDRQICAYCADLFPIAKLTRDHIVPFSRGGRDSWMNVVTACKVSPPKPLLVGLGRHVFTAVKSFFGGSGTGMPYRFGLTSSPGPA